MAAFRARGYRLEATRYILQGELIVAARKRRSGLIHSIHRKSARSPSYRVPRGEDVGAGGPEGRAGPLEYIARSTTICAGPGWPSTWQALDHRAEALVWPGRAEAARLAGAPTGTLVRLLAGSGTFFPRDAILEVERDPRGPG